jgi:hypothetical protein
MAQFQSGQSGNPEGRPKGIKDKRTLFVEIIESRKEELLNKALDMALAGDQQMMRVLLDRLLPAKPKDNQLSNINDFTGATSKKCEKIIASIVDGMITPYEGVVLLQAMKISVELVEFTSVQNRVTAIETILNRRKANEKK